MAKTNAKLKTSPQPTEAVAPPSEASAATTAVAPAPGNEAPAPYRENPRTNEKIDEWIKRNPDQFKFYNEMPHERAVRKLILNEIDRYERRQKSQSYRQQEGGGQTNGQRHDQGRTQSAGGGMRA
jgi:hypothetical protein